MSTIYNPLASGEALLSSFGGGSSASPVADNGISQESAPSVLNIASAASGAASALNGIPGVGSISFGPGLSGATGAVGSIVGLPISRVVAIILGLLLIGGGIIMFRPEVATEIVKGAAAA